MEWDDLPGQFPTFTDPGRWLPLLRRHAELLEAAAPAVRVSSVAPGDVVRRQYAESLELLLIAERYGPEAARAADIGSGGGFPGLAWAAVRPGRQHHLVEPLQKRARLLVELAAGLGLENVTVHPQRAEEAGRSPLRETAAIVTARAVAALPVLLEYVAPLAAPGAVIVLPKGSGLDDELAAAANAMAELACEVVEVAPFREEVNPLARCLVLRKTGPVPKLYPRRPGLPEKRPL